MRALLPIMAAGALLAGAPAGAEPEPVDLLLYDGLVVPMTAREDVIEGGVVAIRGERALDMEETVGSLEPGKLADLVILDARAPNMQPDYDVYATIAFAAYPGTVRSVIVNGEMIVEDQALTRLDRERHEAEWAPPAERVADFAESLR